MLLICALSVSLFQRKYSSVLQRAEMASDDGGERSVMPSTPPLKQATLSTSAITQRKVNSLVLEFIIADVQPFSLVENAPFCEMIQGISGGRTPMCRITLMVHIERGSQNMKEALTETLQDVQTVCTTSSRSKNSLTQFFNSSAVRVVFFLLNVSGSL